MWLPFLLAQPVLAAFDVSVESCDLDREELNRLTALELSSAGAPPLVVDYACVDTGVTIGLSNPTTGIRVERSVTDACCDGVEAERTLALLAASLFKAAEGALGRATAKPGDPSGVDSTEPAPVSAPPPVATPRSAPPSVRAAVPPPAFVPWPAPSLRHDVVDRGDLVHLVSVSGRARAWNLSDPVMGYGVGIDYRGWAWPRFGFGGYASALFGSSDRLGGDVLARSIDLGGVLAWRFARLEPLTLALELAGGLSIVTVEGHAATSEFAAGSLTGATGHTGISLVPSLAFGSTRIELPIEFGALFRAPRGTIVSTLGDAEVQIDGVSVGGALRVSLGFLPRTQKTAGVRR